MTTSKTYKVLHIHTRPIVGGSGTNTLLTMIGLPTTIFEVVLVCGSEGPLPEEARRHGIRVAVIPHLKNEINLKNDFLALREITALLKKEDFTIVHTHNSKAGILGRWAAKICKVPVIVHTMHSCVFRYPNLSSVEKGFFYLLEKWAAGFTDKIITISDALKDIFIKTAVAPVEKFITIYSGIELDRFRVRVNLEQKKMALGIEQGEMVIGIIGRLADGKGHEFVIQAMPVVIQEVPRTRFVFVGDGPLRDQLEGLAVRLGVKEKIIFLGQRTDIPELLQIFDVFCLASLYEGMGRVVLEAQVAGKPVVATRIGGIPDVVSENKTAFLVEPKDSAGLAAALIKLLKDETLRSQMSQAAEEFVDYHFSAQKMVEDIIKVYNELLKLKLRAG